MYQQQNGYQQGFSHGANYNGPPPAKKPKSNPIITRYPPPPGYKGPTQPQPPPQSYSWGQPGYQSYPQQPHATPHFYQQPQWRGCQQQPYSSNGYLPAQGYYPPNASYQAAPYAWQQPTSTPQSAPSQPWLPPPATFDQDKRRHNSAPYPPAKTVSFGPVDGNGDLLPPQQGPVGGLDDLEDDFDGECYFARHPDEVDPNFSLGLIEWHAPLPTKLALPATFAEAELEALAPRKPRADDDPSISDYFTKDKVDERLLNVRQIAAWDTLRDDLVYREFPAVCEEILTMSDVIDRYRDRPDPEWTKSRRSNATSPIREVLRQSAPFTHEPATDAIEVNGRHETPTYIIKHEDSAEHGDILGNLEQALFAGDARNGSNGPQASAGGVHSRTASMSSTAGERITRPKPLAPIRDHAQEDILAALGVTGSPKMVYQTPGPAFAAAPPQHRDNGVFAVSRQSSVTSQPGASRPPPPPPPPAQQQLPTLYHQQNMNGPVVERPNSANSQHTAAGSDFQPDDLNATPRARVNGSDSRKRSHGEFEDGSPGDRRAHVDETTPRPRHKQARVDRAYDRRW